MTVTVTNEILPENLVEARVIADSITGSEGHRVTTIEVNFHRFVLAEMNTHRVFSRNSASSRAIPVPKRLDEFEFQPAFSLNLPAEQPGMQGGDELKGDARMRAQVFLSDLHRQVVIRIRQYIDNNPKPEERLHKSVLARYMEPWLWHRAIITATDWDGFFAQRVSSLAQPEIAVPALLMQQAYEASTPKKIANGGWHLPYVTDAEFNEFDPIELVKLSTARCARVSYLTHDGVYDPEKDVKLWDRLITADPAHASPLEHPAKADFMNVRTAQWEMLDGTSKSKVLPYIGNFVGWTQARHLVLGF